ncbi:MAG: carbamoyl-phosphate synthase large subunit [Alphaproteobacteria bacterium]|nr:carbamoyl-phosphate synthase large subunit [Alphaproteobacteria bacterium]
MSKIGLNSPKSHAVNNIDDAQKVLHDIGLPAIIRPSFTLGGTGGGIAYNRKEFEEIAKSGLAASMIGEILVEESVLGWKEYEMEVVRDKADNCIIICSIENVDPMGIHTGDSITVAPALTLTDKEYQVMRNASLAVLREIGVDTGGSNVQFAVNPADGRMVVIEMNPRVSRSSALASKATGFPIAKIAAKLAVGYTLDELTNDMTKVTPASFEPTIDYVVTKIPRFTFEKFPGTDATLTTSMKSVGEAMAIGRNWHESVQKALRSLETGLSGFDDVALGDGQSRDAVVAALAKPTPDRLLVIAQALRQGLSIAEVCQICSYDPWFVARIADIVQAEQQVRQNGLPDQPRDMHKLKHMGFSDKRLAKLAGKKESDVRQLRDQLNVHPVFKRIDTCAGEFKSNTAYMYATYEGQPALPAVCEAAPSDKQKIIILGGGPNRIGQGIEFDYCCVHAAFALREAGFETIMVNCNPETVSTDYDTSDRLYFEPLTAEDVIEIVRTEQKNGTLLGVIVQFGGQTPLRLAEALQDANIPILGTSPDAIDLAEDRERFQKLLNKLKLLQPPNGLARSAIEAEKIAEKIGYPVVIRPSYVLGGRAMEIVHDTQALQRYITQAVSVSGDNPVLIDHYLRNAIEVDVDVLADGRDVFVAGVMEHIEEAGIHSGDSSCSLPPFSLSADIVKEMSRQAEELAKALNVVGLMNVQFAVKDKKIYVLEVNPRASRTVPFVAKATGVPVAKLAARLMAGEKLKNMRLKHQTFKHLAVKTPVFPFARFNNVDVILGPEMKSTGEVMGVDADFAAAFAKAQLGAGMKLPKTGTIFMSVRDEDKHEAARVAKKFVDEGFRLIATRGTAKALQDEGVPVRVVNKVFEGQPHIVDALINGEVALVVNTTEGAAAIADSFSIRRTALMQQIPYYTTITAARAVADAIAAVQKETLEVQSLQGYLKAAS